jgi:hypothetical protein
MGSGASKQRRADQPVTHTQKSAVAPVLEDRVASEEDRPADTGDVEGAEADSQVAQEEGDSGETGEAGVGDPFDPEDAAPAGPELRFVSEEEQEDLMQRYSNLVFYKADMHHQGALDIDAFCLLVQSATLDLRLGRVEAEEMFRKYARKDRVYLDSFRHVLSELLQLYSSSRRENSEPAFEWFGLYFDDPDSLPAFYNTELDCITYNKPLNYVARSPLENQDFEQVVMTDGTVSVAPISTHSHAHSHAYMHTHIYTHTHTHSHARTLSLTQVYTSFVNAFGERLFLDFKSGEWLPFPDELLQEIEDIVKDMYDDDKAEVASIAGPVEEVFLVPSTGRRYETMLEDGKRTYFDEKSGEWATIPISLEAHVPSVMKILGEMQQLMPEWRDITERIMALRQHNYNVKHTLDWKRREDKFGSELPFFQKPKELPAKSAREIDELEGTIILNRETIESQKLKILELEIALKAAQQDVHARLIATMETENKLLALATQENVLSLANKEQEMRIQSLVSASLSLS